MFIWKTEKKEEKKKEEEPESDEDMGFGKSYMVAEIHELSFNGMISDKIYNFFRFIWLRAAVIWQIN